MELILKPVHSKYVSTLEKGKIVMELDQISVFSLTKKGSEYFMFTCHYDALDDMIKDSGNGDYYEVMEKLEQGNEVKIEMSFSVKAILDG